MNKIFSYEMMIKEHHLDFLGHVNNAVYLEILEEARWDFITAGGYGYKRFNQDKKGPIVLDVHLRFSKELTNRKNIIIKSQVQSGIARVMCLKQWIVDAAGIEYARAEFKMAFFDMLERKIIAPSEDWIAAIGLSDIGK
jgi:YbgC/YbaW family acyl-CoA thioester hydrolase